MSVMGETPARTRRSFTDEFKRDAVAMVLDVHHVITASQTGAAKSASPTVVTNSSSPAVELREEVDRRNHRHLACEPEEVTVTGHDEGLPRLGERNQVVVAQVRRSNTRRALGIAEHARASSEKLDELARLGGRHS